LSQASSRLTVFCTVGSSKNRRKLISRRAQFFAAIVRNEGGRDAQCIRSAVDSTGRDGVFEQTRKSIWCSVLGMCIGWVGARRCCGLWPARGRGVHWLIRREEAG